MVEEPDRGPDDAGPPAPAGGWARFAQGYVDIRAVTIARDGGPSRLLRTVAGAPVAATAVIVLALAGIVGVTFGVPPLSPLFLVAVLAAPAYPWLRLEARAIDAWRSRGDDAGT